MAEAHKFTGNLDDAVEVFSDLPWKRTGGGKNYVWDAKEEKYVPVAKGQFIVSIGDRYEVADTYELPKRAKPATEKDEKPVEKAKAKAEEAKADEAEEK